MICAGAILAPSPLDIHTCCDRFQAQPKGLATGQRRSQAGETMNDQHKLQDVLRPGLRLVFCGTAAGTKSAEVRQYYAGPGNQFWRVLATTGLTPRQLAPAEFAILPDFGIGLTDMAKLQSGADNQLTCGAFDVAAMKAKLVCFQPRVVCFNGKKAAQVFFARTDLDYGLQPADHSPGLPGIRFFIAPSTSGAARRYWDEARWVELKGIVGE